MLTLARVLRLYWQSCSIIRVIKQMSTNTIILKKLASTGQWLTVALLSLSITACSSLPFSGKKSDEQQAETQSADALYQSANWGVMHSRPSWKRRMPITSLMSRTMHWIRLTAFCV